MVHGYVLLDSQRVDAAMPSVVLGAADHGMISTVPELNTFVSSLAQGKLLDTKTVVDMYTLNPINKEEEYGLGLQQKYDACSNHYYFGHVGDVPGYGSVALTSADGSRHIAIAVAFPPASPPKSFDEPVIDMLSVAIEALNMACLTACH